MGMGWFDRKKPEGSAQRAHERKMNEGMDELREAAERLTRSAEASASSYGDSTQTARKRVQEVINELSGLGANASVELQGGVGRLTVEARGYRGSFELSGAHPATVLNNLYCYLCGLKAGLSMVKEKPKEGCGTDEAEQVYAAEMRREYARSAAVQLAALSTEKLLELMRQCFVSGYRRARAGAKV